MSLKLMSFYTLKLMSLNIILYNYIDVITKMERISREKKIS